MGGKIFHVNNEGNNFKMKDYFSIIFIRLFRILIAVYKD